MRGKRLGFCHNVLRCAGDVSDDLADDRARVWRGRAWAGRDVLKRFRGGVVSCPDPEIAQEKAEKTVAALVRGERLYDHRQTHHRGTMCAGS